MNRAEGEFDDGRKACEAGGTTDMGGPAASQFPTETPSSRRLRWPEMLMHSVWFGLLTGYGEAVVLELKWLVLGQPTRNPDQMIWMAPLADGLIFGVAGAVLAVVGRYWSAVTSPRIVAFVFLFALAFSLRRAAESIHLAAWLLLSAGVAASGSRWIATRASGFMRCVRRTLFPAAATVGILAAGMSWGRSWLEARANSELPAAAAERPNVLFIVLDTVRAESLSLYGYHRDTTPFLREFAQRGVRFDHAIATSPWTLPSHASMFTGRLPFEMSADWRSALDDTHPTVAELLCEQGYATAGFVANHWYGTRCHGLNRGFAHYEDYKITWRQIIECSRIGSMVLMKVDQALHQPHLERKVASEVNGSFLAWLDDRDARRPFLAFLNYMEAHEPYIAAPPYENRFSELKAVDRYFEDDVIDNLPELDAQRDEYDRCVADLDGELRRLFAELETRKLLSNTLVVITADHGEQFGEHGLVDHGNSLYMPLLHVPLLISLPGRLPAGGVVDEFVSLADVPQTVLELSAATRPSWRLGESLTRRLPAADRGPSVARRQFSQLRSGSQIRAGSPIARGSMQSVVDDPFHYILNGDGVEELYDLRQDPRELKDLSGIPEHQDTLRRLGAAVKDGPTSVTPSPADELTDSKAVKGDGAHSQPRRLANSMTSGVRLNAAATEPR